MANEVKFKATALQQLGALSAALQKSAADIFDLLEVDDMPAGAILLRNRPDLRRIYLTKCHRIIYSVPDKNEVLILRIRERATVYSHLTKLRSR